MMTSIGRDVHGYANHWNDKLHVDDSGPRLVMRTQVLPGFRDYNPRMVVEARDEPMLLIK